MKIINRLHRTSAARRMIFVLTGALCLAGYLAYARLPVDALPDLNERQVLVTAQWPSHSAEEVNRQVTLPLESRMRGMDRVKTVRGTSMPGSSMLTVVFADSLSPTVARATVAARNGTMHAELPPGVAAELGVDANGLSWVYEFYLEPLPGHSTDLAELRDDLDLVVRPALESVPGVAEVAAIGGYLREMRVNVSPSKLRATGLNLQQIGEAIQKSIGRVVGGAIEENGLAYPVTAVAEPVAELEENWLRRIRARTSDGTVVRIGDVANTEVDAQPRAGVLDVNGVEAVGGIVVMRQGENAARVIEDVKRRLRDVHLKGVQIRAFYDRSEFIAGVAGSLRRLLLEEVLLVALVHIVFLMHWPSILAVTLPLPAALAGSFVCLYLSQTPFDAMSAAGLALAVGLLVDAGIVLCEAVLRNLETNPSIDTAIAEALRLLQRPIAFCFAIVLVAFLPVFLLTGQAGKLFHPLASAKTSAIAVAAILAFTLTPALLRATVSAGGRRESENPLLRILLPRYEQILRACLRHPARVMATAIFLFAGSVTLATRLGHQFVPAINEGSLLSMPSLLPGISLPEAKRIVAWQDRTVRSIPEVALAVGKLGRAETSTDRAPLEMVETVISFKPPSEWRPGSTARSIAEEVRVKLSALPGVNPSLTQPIATRVQMLTSGVRAPLALKLYGSDAGALLRTAQRVADLLRRTRGTSAVAIMPLGNRPELRISPNATLLAAVGMTSADVLETVETGFGGHTIAFAPSGRRSIPITVRWNRQARESLDSIRQIPVVGVNGQVFPLREVAKIETISVPSEFLTEDGESMVAVLANIENRSAAEIVAEIEPKLGFVEGRWEWSGEYRNLKNLLNTLCVVLPLAAATIFALLWLLYRNFTQALHVILAIPFALSGGLFFQWLLGSPFNAAIWIGYIGLFGTATQTSVLMVTYLNEAIAGLKPETPQQWTDAIVAGSVLRLRPKIMTVLTIMVSGLPAFWVQGGNSELMKAFAIPLVGGMVSSLLHVLVVTPVLYANAHGRRRKTSGQAVTTIMV